MPPRSHNKVTFVKGGAPRTRHTDRSQLRRLLCIHLCVAKEVCHVDVSTSVVLSFDLVGSTLTNISKTLLNFVRVDRSRLLRRHFHTIYKIIISHWSFCQRVAFVITGQPRAARRAHFLIVTGRGGQDRQLLIFKWLPRLFLRGASRLQQYQDG